MRSLSIAIYVFLAYVALRAVLRWLLQRGTKSDARPSNGGEMVLDPQCRTYVLKERAVTRRLRGGVACFCSEECAAAYELERRA